MKRITLILLILLFFRQIAVAQNKLADASDHQLSESVLLKSDSFDPSPGDGSIDLNYGSDADSASGQTPAGSTQTKKPKTPSKPTVEPQMPTIQKIRIGYLDSAIIGTSDPFSF
jgi:hypothetical protein